jgi:hypothetical protein
MVMMKVGMIVSSHCSTNTMGPAQPRRLYPVPLPLDFCAAEIGRLCQRGASTITT